MHYAPVLSLYLVDGNVRDRDSAPQRIRRVYVRHHRSWTNWWNMSVTEEPNPSVGERGRLPGV